MYTAPNRDAAEAELDLFLDKWGRPYPAIVGLWRNAWEEFTPFLAYDVEIRRVICSTNAIESLKARFRRAVRAGGHFPTEQAVRHHLRRPHADSNREPLKMNAIYTVHRTDPFRH